MYINTFYGCQNVLPLSNLLCYYLNTKSVHTNVSLFSYTKTFPKGIIKEECQRQSSIRFFFYLYPHKLRLLNSDLFHITPNRTAFLNIYQCNSSNEALILLIHFVQYWLWKIKLGNKSSSTLCTQLVNL